MNLNEKRLEKLFDLIETLNQNGYEEIAEELSMYLLDINIDTDRLYDIYSMKLKSIKEKEEKDFNWKDISYDEEGNKIVESRAELIYWIEDLQYINIANRLEDKRSGYKDIVKYVDCYLYLDWTLWRRMVRWNQMLGLSNIEKCEENYNTPAYERKRKGIKEKIRRVPRVEDVTLLKWCQMLNKRWIDINDYSFKELIRETRRRWLECPTLEEIKDEIERSISHIEEEDNLPREYQSKQERFDKDWFEDLFTLEEIDELKVELNVYSWRAINNIEFKNTKLMKKINKENKKWMKEKGYLK